MEFEVSVLCSQFRKCREIVVTPLTKLNECLSICFFESLVFLSKLLKDIVILLNDLSEGQLVVAFSYLLEVLVVKHGLELMLNSNFIAN